MDNSLFIDMSFRILLLWVGFILLKLAFILIISIGNFMVRISLIITSLMFSGIEFFENLQPFLFFYIIVVNELWMVEWHIRKGLTKVVKTIHFVHELSWNLIALRFVSDNPYACSRWNTNWLGNSWKQMIIDNYFSHSLLQWLINLFFYFDDSCWPLISKNIIISTIWATAFFTLLILWFFILNTKIICTKIIFILLDFFNKPHVDEIIYLLLLILCPLIIWGLLSIWKWVCWVWVFNFIFFILLVFLKFLLMLLSIIILQKLFFVSFKLILP